MEADRPMDNDERDESAERWAPRPPDADSQPAEPDQASGPEPPADAESEIAPTDRPAEPQDEGAGDEFETATWPAQDLSEESAPPPSEAEAYAPGTDAADEAPMPAHSVPATEPGESTRCPRCGTENRPGLSFCRNCGQRLVAAGAPTTVERPSPPDGTQACPRCGTHNRAGAAFCQNCGANLRAATEGYVPPAVPPAAAQAGASTEMRGPAVLGPIVLLIGAVGLMTAWLLPFAIGNVSLWEASFGSSDGYGLSFWSAFDGLASFADQLYLGLAAAAPLLVVLLVVLAIAGFLRPAPAALQMIGLAVCLVWAVGLVVLFLVVEVFGSSGGSLLDILRGLSPAGIIFMLASLIVVIGALTRIGRS
jgi:Double zinc ribbon